MTCPTCGQGMPDDISSLPTAGVLTLLETALPLQNWYYETEGYQTHVDGLGIVTLEKSETEVDSYGDPQSRYLVFKLEDCSGSRYFKIEGTSDSYGDGAWLHETFREVRPRTLTIETFEGV